MGWLVKCTEKDCTTTEIRSKMKSQEAYNKLNRARVYLLNKKDWDALSFLDSHILKFFRSEEERDFATGESIRYHK